MQTMRRVATAIAAVGLAAGCHGAKQAPTTPAAAAGGSAAVVSPGAAPSAAAPPKAAPQPRPDVEKLLGAGTSGDAGALPDGRWLVVGIADDTVDGAVPKTVALLVDRGEVMDRGTLAAWAGKADDWSCDNQVSVGIDEAPDPGTFALELGCVSGEDVLVGTSRLVVLRARPGLAKLGELQQVWAGAGERTASNQVSGCLEGEHAKLERRGDGLYLVRTAYREYEGEGDAPADCKPGSDAAKATRVAD